MSTDQQVHMVSLHGDLIIFQCKHLSPKASEVTFCRVSFNRDLGTFTNKDDEVSLMYKNASRAVSIVRCAAAVNARMRQRVPCVLLRLHRKASQGFKYMLYSLTGKTRAKLHAEFSWPYEISEDVSILRGPTLVWSYQDVVFYTSAETGGVKEVPMHLRVNFIGELPLPQRHLVVLGSEKTTEENGEDKPLLYLLEDGRTFGADRLLPAAYSVVVRCMLVPSAQTVDGSLGSTVVAVTSRKQLVWFENGLPEEVCPLPYDEPQSVRLVYTGSGCLIAVVFGHGNVCAVWKDSFKVAACWTDVRLLLVDDFIGAGFEQMLLVFEEIDSADGTLGKFLLTDLAGVCYLHGGPEGGDGRQCETAEENMNLTIQALEARLRSGLVFQQELRRDLCVKDRVIQQCVSALRDLLSDRKHVMSPAPQEGLVSLLDDQSEEDECAPSCVRREMTFDESLPKVERVWHRVIAQTLVFGALLTPANQTTESESGVMMAAVVATPTLVQSLNKTLCYPEPLTSAPSGPPDAKRSKFPSGTAILLTTDLAPLLTSDPDKCSVLLCFSTSDAGSSALHCELVRLNLKGALEGKFQLRLLEDCSLDSDESREDLLSLMAASQFWVFRLVSTDHTVVDVSRFLEEKFGAKRVQISPQYLLSRSTHPSSVSMLFHWKPCSSFDGILDVYSSDHLGLLGFLDSFCNFLPSSHCISLLRTGQGRNKSPALFMEHEILTIKEGVAELIHSDPKEPSELHVHVHPEQWLNERSAQLRPPVEVKRYQKMVERAIDLKMTSDVAVLMEAELNGKFSIPRRFAHRNSRVLFHGLTQGRTGLVASSGQGILANVD
ncbi:Fanconi anemia group B protein [Clarias magur]|uniref:Fanconi anemia group B protein n=1 Tax=Clarias magur TaxID=1594786 RepID=A0A8J4WV74_CLAMG|nr:Fanconi anemia group B protein [Clarias magur]